MKSRFTLIKYFWRPSSSEGGYTLLVAVAALAAISLYTFAYVKQSESTITNSGLLMNRRATMYVAEGLRNAAMYEVGNYMSANPIPQPSVQATIASLLTADLPSYLQAPYSVVPVVQTVSGQNTITIQGGPYSGVSALSNDITFKINVANAQPNQTYNVTIQADMTIAQIAMFEYNLFSTLEFTNLDPATVMSLTGPVYAAGDLCVGANGIGSLELFHVTTSGNLMQSQDTRCKYPTTTTVIPAQIHFDTTASTNPLLLSADSGCTNCQATGTDWPTFAQNQWQGFAQDKASTNVPLISLPGQGSNVVAQAGANATFTTPYSNDTQMRYLVDPPKSADTAPISVQKYSNLSDIRIINGVWYVADLVTPTNWPGIPIWSDHPGHVPADADVGGTLAIGQDDIKLYWSTRRAWVGVPKGFSFYKYAEGPPNSNYHLVPEFPPTGTISYGSLITTYDASFNTTTLPGFRLGPDSAAYSTNLCPGPGGVSSPAIPAPGPTPSGAAVQIATSAPANEVTCASGASPDNTAVLLAATREGFSDPQIASSSSNTAPDAASESGSLVLPTNFDMGAFGAAMASTVHGELGSYFVGGYYGRAFNGIVYISSTWPGSGAGYGTPATWPVPFPVPSVLPSPRFQPDLGQPGIFSAAQERALPYELCSISMAGKYYDTRANASAFLVPNCSTGPYGPGTTAYPSVVRLYNGSDIKTNFPNGLSIVSNLPVYLMGDMNATSNVTSAAATNWAPLLVAGDQITVLSKYWSDEHSPWDYPDPGSNQPLRGLPAGAPPLTMTINSAMILGWMLNSSTKTGLQNSTGLIENLGVGTQYYITGSLVAGFYPVYQRAPRNNVGNNVFTPPTRYFAFDPHFTLLSNQPPGTPTFTVWATSFWNGN